MKKILIILILTVSKTLFCQKTLVETFESKILNEKRTIRIHIPKSFEKTENFPLILTLDGEYMFYNLIGNSELLLATEKIPESVIVGIDQNYFDSTKIWARNNDCSYNSKNAELKGKGIKFKEFIEKELVPYLTDKYKAGNYKVLAGHSFTATYPNFFLFDNSVFNSYILLSPYLNERISKKIIDKLSNNNKFLSYYISTSQYDLPGHLKTVKKIDSTLTKIVFNPKTEYTFNNFKGETHYSLINRSFPFALEAIFKDYSIITDKEIELEIQAVPVGIEIMAPPGMEEMTNQLQGMFQNLSNNKTKTRKLKVQDAMKILVTEEFQTKMDKKKNHKSIIYFPPLNQDFLFYSSYGESGDNGLDIYFKKRLSSGGWSTAKILPENINSPYDEDFPFLSSNGTTFYFSSMGHNSMGGYDIFRCNFNSSTNDFGPISNLDYKINSTDDDILYLVDKNNKNAIFSSKRSSEGGMIDVYNVKVQLLPMQNIIISGSFKNSILIFFAFSAISNPFGSIIA